jgi:hypothetical protein
MTPAISEVVLKETFPQYFSSKLILVLQIKLKYMMSLKKYLIQECQEFVLVPTKPIKNQEIKYQKIKAFRSFKIAHRLDSLFFVHDMRKS